MKIVRKARRILNVPWQALLGYYGAMLSKVSPPRHERFMRRRLSGPYRGRLADELMSILNELQRTGDQHAAMEAASRAIRDGLEQGEFDRWLAPAAPGREKATLIECANFLPGRSWKLQLFFIREGHSHPPHSHSDVASCLVVAGGKIHAREFDRHFDLEDDRDHAILSLASDRCLSRGDALLTTRSSNDVHWFGAVDGPAQAFNFQAVGFVRGRGALEARRVYVDATGVGAAGKHKALKLNSREAKRRFAERPLSDFPVQS